MTALHRPNPLIPQPAIESTRRCLTAAGRFIDIYYSILKSSNVPLSWMLLQGTLLSATTLLVTAKMNGLLLLRQNATSIPMIMDWNRKCSVIFAIISERWSDPSIHRLETQINLLATDTIKQLLKFQTTLGTEQDMTQSQHNSKHGALPSSTVNTGSSYNDCSLPEPSTGGCDEFAHQGPFATGPSQASFLDGDHQLYNNEHGIAATMSEDLFHFDTRFEGDGLFDYYSILQMGGERIMDTGLEDMNASHWM